MYQSGLWEAGYGVVRVGTGGDAWWILRWISSLHGMARDGFWWFQRCFMDVHELWDVILASQWRTQSMSYGRWWNCTASTTKQVYCKHHGIIMGIMVVFFRFLGYWETISDWVFGNVATVILCGKVGILWHPWRILGEKNGISSSHHDGEKDCDQVSLGSWSSILTLEDWRMNEGNLMTERKPPNLSVFV